MSEFSEQLKENDIDPDKFIEFQIESIAQARSFQELNRRISNAADHLEREHLLTMMEIFVVKLQRERLRDKLKS